MGSSSSASAPKILSIGTNVKTLHEGDQLIVTAVVTDPDGIDDLIGGKLTSADGGATYGSFATDQAEGAYSLTLQWSAINQADSINTGAGMSESRPFRATFFDAEGNTTYHDVAVALQCSAASNAACDGHCTDMSTPSLDHCGSCDHKCPSDSLNQKQCVLQNGGVCEGYAASQQRVACTSLCPAGYSKCYAAGAYYGNSQLALACSAIPPAMNGTDAFVEIACQCADR
jgi:hypothetical protein